MDLDMAFQKLLLVFWKIGLIRRRHWILSIIETLLPVALFVVIAYIRSAVPEFKKVEMPMPTYCDQELIDYNSLSIESTHFLYTPNTEFYRNVVNRAMLKFQMYGDHIRGFNSEQKLEDEYQRNHDETTIAVVFKGDDKKTFDYTIRYHDSRFHDFIHTSKLFASGNMEAEICNTPDYIWSGFLSIQKALDISFIEESMGTDLENNITISMKAFPYPPYVKDLSLDNILQEYLPAFTLFSFIFICPAVLQRIMEEKQSGTKELLKMVGMKPWMLWLGWEIHGTALLTFSVICIVILMKVPFFGSTYPLIEYTDGTILFAFLMLYVITAVVFTCAISTFFRKPAFAMVAALLIWVLSYFVPKYSAGLEDTSNSLPWAESMALCLLPNMLLHYGFAAISACEVRGVGVHWLTMSGSGTGGTEDVTMIDVFRMLMFDMVFYKCVTFYVDGINPGKYGVRKSLLFPLHAFIKMVTPKKKNNSIFTNHETSTLKNIEEGHDFKKGIEIRNLYKRFGNKMAVENLNLDIYKNQITVLLGHNGAGKSTTMSVITGMLGATSGVIKINGEDITTNMDNIRSNMGLCPQHNLLFTDLTVKEHLVFFAKLKGRTFHDAVREANGMLRKLNLSGKGNELANTLSGGMKRKLCLGMALIGGSKVLILDEPSSGMDPESRRELWDLLLSWRGQKTILITTHFMEEADALGDWIAIMSQGTLQCYGTPMYLKKLYDTGYHLSLITKDNLSQDDKKHIKNYISNLIRESQLKSQDGKNMVFVIPFESKTAIPKLLSSLEQEKDELKIENISVTITTLEDVFLKTGAENNSVDEVCADTRALLTKKTTDGRAKTTKASQNKHYHMGILLWKRYWFFLRKPAAYLPSIVIAAVFFILAVYLASSSNGHFRSNGPELKYDLRSYSTKEVYYNSTDPNILQAYNETVAKESAFASKVCDVEDEIIKDGLANILYYMQHMIAGAVFESKDGKINAIGLYNPKAIHSTPISLNLMTNALVKSLLGEDYSITTSNWPLKSVNSNISPQEYSKSKVALMWSIMVPLGCLLIQGSFILFPHTEISSKFVQLQYMCGVKPLLYWFVNFLADMLLYGVVMVVFAMIVCAGFDLFRGLTEFGVMITILLTYGLCCIPYSYLFSRRKSASGAFALFVILGMFLGGMLSLIIGALLLTDDDYYNGIGEVLKVVAFLFVPQVGLTYTGYEFAKKAVENYNMDVNPMRTGRDEPCFDRNSPECVTSRSYTPILNRNVYLMVISCLIYFTINVLLDTYCVRKFFSHIKFKLLQLRYSLKDNRQEKRNDVELARTSIGSLSNPTGTLRAVKLKKSYSGKAVVKGINITLNNGECLGILGVNGAGKTTTFRMLTREEIVNEGRVMIMVDGNEIDINKDEYLENLGYCPQTDALNFVLTGHQILSVIAQLRGENDPKKVDAYLEFFGLKEYAHMPCGLYSGGNKRKLSLAVSLIGSNNFVLLDEPTNGVDPSSRRKCWNLIKAVQGTNGLSFILTSHSMAECEALCDNLKIMKDGEFQKEGTISELKNDFGGFSIKLKLTGKKSTNRLDDLDEIQSSIENLKLVGEDVVDSPTASNQEVSEKLESNAEENQHVQSTWDQSPEFADVKELKDYFENCQGATLKDEHSGQLYYYIKNKKRNWSDIFQQMEGIKEKNSHLIEDYAISEASLEDVFLSVARSDDEKSKTTPRKLQKVIKRKGRLTV